MRLLTKIMFLTIVGTIGWWIGGKLSTDATTLALGCLLGIMGGIPIALAALYSNRDQRVDHYHHHEHRTLAEPQEKPAAQPQRYIVVSDRPQLQQQARQQIEVKHEIQRTR